MGTDEHCILLLLIVSILILDRVPFWSFECITMNCSNAVFGFDSLVQAILFDAAELVLLF